ncbi:MAG TPA: hypothetical protein VFX12_14450 [Vicinamibacterales bacterium]|nr:hypothetical protein [Vicinamibacterales bacterium]
MSMTSQSGPRRPVQLMTGLFVASLLAAGFGAACASSSTTASATTEPSTPAAAATSSASAATAPAAPRRTPPPPLEPAPAVLPAPVAPVVSETAPSPDPRVGLKAGIWDPGEAAWNMKMISSTPPKGKVLGATHSDLAFSGKYAIQGNYDGFEIYDVSNPSAPVLVQSYLCPASQNDVSVYRNLLFMSSEATNSRADCGFGGVPDPVSSQRVRGIRIFDISDVQHPKLVTDVQTCRGSHTHTVVTQPGDDNDVYIYVSGLSRVRSDKELAGCEDGGIDDPNSARFRLEVIKVPLAHPEQAAIVSSPRIFNDLPVPPRNAERDAIDAAARAARAARAGRSGRAGAPGAGRGGRGGPGRGNAAPSGPNQCHDITVYPQIGLAGGACAGMGLLLDIHDAAHPVRIDAASDANMSFWHSATFSNDGSKILFTDEWGGGSQPRCRATDKKEWGADALFTIENRKLVFHTYYKMPAAQTEQENCVAHNGSLVPIPGREVMVQSWYQGGVSVFDWTDVNHPKEIAYFDRGPMNASRLVDAGSWSAYWYNGVIVSSEIARGLDIYELVPSGLITENELAAAKTVHVDYWNTQDQQRMVWPPSFALARAYLDQLERSKGLSADAIASARAALSGAEQQSGAARASALTQLASQIESAAGSSSDQAKVQTLSKAVTDLANTQG